MTAAVIITLCSLLLIAYLFDLTASKTRIPSVILLLLLGWIVRQITSYSGVVLPNLSSILPILGTIGLVLIVLEGSLELELEKSKIGLIKKSFWGALIPMLSISFILAYCFQFFGDYPFKVDLVNAIPFSIISSAVAIPSVRNLKPSNREFVIYESSLSDILGVIFFNFVALNENFNPYSFGQFGLQLLIIIVISFFATILLSFLIGKIDHHIKFVPIILLIILIYEVLKIYHLPALLFILLFGLFIGNLDELSHLKWVKKLRPDILDKEVNKFKELTIEGTFIVRAIFFLLFGYLLETSEILNTETLVWSVGIVFLILLIRAIQLKLSGLPLRPLLFVAPRGLITILLFISILPAQKIIDINKSLIVQVIILTAFTMMIGLMTNNRRKPQEEEIEKQEQHK